MVVDWKMSPVHPSSSIYRVLEEIKEIPAESWWNSYLPMPLSFPLGGSLSIMIAIEESKREWMFRCFMLVDWIRRKKIVFFYVREVNLTESKVSWLAKCYIFGTYVLIFDQRKILLSLLIYYFAKLLKIAR